MSEFDQYLRVNGRMSLGDVAREICHQIRTDGHYKQTIMKHINSEDDDALYFWIRTIAYFNIRDGKDWWQRWE